MRAARVHDYDAADGLSVDRIDPPVITDDQILVRVHAASVNPVDWKMRDGILRSFMTFDLPVVLGGDLSGVVEQIGTAVTDFAIGDHVHAMAGTHFSYANGAFADYIAVPAANAAPKPPSLDHVHAAAVPLAALTAWQALHDRGAVQAGQRVLIHAAAGGVGGYAVQFAHAAGAHVIGTASAANAAYVRGLGADAVIDYATAPFEEGLRDIDLVIDLVGGDVQTRSFAVLRPGGKLVNAWGALATEAADAAGVIAVKVAVQPNGAQLRAIDALIETGAVRVDVAHRFPLEAVNDALALSRRGHGRGKIVLDIASG